MWTTTLLAMGMTVCSFMGGVSMTTAPPASTTGGASSDMSTVVMTTGRQPDNTGRSFSISATTNGSGAADETTGVMTSADETTGVATSADATPTATGGATSKTSAAAGAGGAVPGWGIALLALAALLLGLLLAVLVAAIFWCCCNRGRYNHPADIPLYNTHSQFWKVNSVPAYEDLDKDVKMTK
ncbi:uncharacterized protein LOC144057906 isoform X2 [Vanacampus margaritifer]